MWAMNGRCDGQRVATIGDIEDAGFRCKQAINGNKTIARTQIGRKILYFKANFNL